MLMRATHGDTVEQPGLLLNFDLLAKAPGGVARLRELILTLAVQGKLVEQDAGDEPAAILLHRIRAEKERQQATGLSKREKTAVALNEPPFNLPKGWEWACLGQVCSYIQRGKSPSYVDQSDYRVVSQKCVRWHGLDMVPARFIEPASLSKYEAIRFLQAGDMLWNSTGTGTIGRACLVPNELGDSLLVADSHVTVVRPRLLNGEFLWRWAQSPFVQAEIEAGASGTTNQIELNISTVVAHLIPIPPLAEQSRIVARVEELMRLCDALEAKGKLEGAQHSQLLTTLLRTLTDSSSAEELAGNWQRVAAHFDLLLDRPEAVDALEQTILQLAVRGFLVPQDPQDEPASVLLQSIRAQKGRLIAEGKIKRYKQADGIADDERFFDIPITWCWAQAQDVCDPGSLITYGILKPVWVDVGVPTVRVQDLKNGKIVTSSLGQCAPDRADRFDKTKLAAGDLLIAKDGATLGKTAFVPPELAGANVTQHVLRFPISGVVSRQYVRLIVDSAYGQAWMKSETKGVALPGVNVGDFRRMPIPLPPLAEQVRIFARVTELRHLCAELRQRLASARNVQAQFAQAQVEALAL